MRATGLKLFFFTYCCKLSASHLILLMNAIQSHTDKMAPCCEKALWHAEQSPGLTRPSVVAGHRSLRAECLG